MFDFLVLFHDIANVRFQFRRRCLCWLKIESCVKIFALHCVLSLRQILWAPLIINGNIWMGNGKEGNYKISWKIFWEKVVCILCFFFLRLFSSLRKSTILLSVLPEGTIKDRYTTDSPFPGASQRESLCSSSIYLY